ncbi:MAG: tetratricopeptide repeat protein [Chloroflexi bacterium]|nr:tetratricopeptide repeat protein [Chloroflexota bacterium]
MKTNWDKVGALLGIPGCLLAIGAVVAWLNSNFPKPILWATLGVAVVAIVAAGVILGRRFFRKTAAQPEEKPPPPDPLGIPLHEPEGFVGRTAELADVVAALLDRRSLLIPGEPGIGKTELAVQSLRSPNVQRAYQGRLHYLNLEGRAHISLVNLCDDVARSLDALAVLQTEDLDQKIPILIANLGNPPPLIVFNNADGPATVDAVAAFRRRVMDGPLLVTSRDAIPGMTTLELLPLKPDPAFRLFARYAGRPPTPEERQAVEGILAFLQNNPLAITVAAPLLPRIGAAELGRQLTTRPGQALGPVWTAFALSYGFLSEKAKRLFPALSLFAGPDFSADAVKSLFDEDIALELGNLVGVSLLRRDQATGRYSLHPLLKEYARGKLENADALHLRLAAYYAQFTGAHDQPTEEHLNAIALDFPNIRGAVEWCLARPKEEPPVLPLTDLAINLYHFLMVRGYWAERIYWGEAAVEAAKAMSDEQRLALVVHQLGIAYQMRGRRDEAMACFAQSLELNRRLGNDKSVAGNLYQLGILAQNQGRPEEARDLYQQARAIFKRLGDEGAIASTVHQLGMLAYSQGYMDEAHELYHQARATFARLGDQQGIASTLHELGRVAQRQGRRDEASDLYRQSLGIKKRLGDQQGIAAILHQLGNLAEAQDLPDEANDYYQQAKTTFEGLGDQRGIAGTLHGLGVVAQKQHRLDEARDLYQQARAISERLGDQQSLAGTLHQLGMLAEDQSHTDEARDYCHQAKEVFERLGDQRNLAFTIYQLGRLDEHAGNLELARSHFFQALEILERLRSPDAETARRSLQRVQEQLKAAALPPP